MNNRNYHEPHAPIRNRFGKAKSIGLGDQSKAEDASAEAEGWRRTAASFGPADQFNAEDAPKGAEIGQRLSDSQYAQMTWPPAVARAQQECYKPA
jgi:hypothetical protein